MKRTFLSILVAAVVFASCVKKNTPTIPLDNIVDTSDVTPGSMGRFMNGPYGNVNGLASIYQKPDSSYVLSLREMNISNGPDLHVYISREQLPVNFIDLGRLQSTIGNQLYNIPGKPDFETYRYALIHCQRYNHLFGSAELR